jgi:F-type H+-transporting ATPase subunit b
VIENWWSWDYGPGKTHHHPPFGFALINFAVFLFILNKLAGKSFKEFLANRHLEVRKALDRARDLEKQAQAQLTEYEKKGQAMQAEIDALLAAMKEQAQVERQRIIARAEAEAEKLLKDAEAQVQQTIEGAKRDLERKTALLAVDLAEKLVTSRINDFDQRNLVERFVTQVESAAAPGQAATGGRP